MEVITVFTILSPLIYFLGTVVLVFMTLAAVLYAAYLFIRACWKILVAIGLILFLGFVLFIVLFPIAIL